ncbi:MAG: VRR-NUC domain-containing protein [Paracoccaceae bacterium]
MGKREAPIQRAIVGYLRRVMPGAVVHHCKNEINKRGKAIAIELSQAKANGSVTGFPDLIVITHVGTLFFEVKAEGNYATPAQKAVHASISALGHRVAVVRSIDDVRECLIAWSVGFIETLPIRGTVT